MKDTLIEGNPKVKVEVGKMKAAAERMTTTPGITVAAGNGTLFCDNNVLSVSLAHTAAFQDRHKTVTDFPILWMSSVRLREVK